MRIFPPVPLANLHYCVTVNGMFSLSMKVKGHGTYSRLEFAWPIDLEGLLIVEPYRNCRLSQRGEIGIK